MIKNWINFEQNQEQLFIGKNDENQANMIHWLKNLKISFDQDSFQQFLFIFSFVKKNPLIYFCEFFRPVNLQLAFKASKWNKIKGIESLRGGIWGLKFSQTKIKVKYHGRLVLKYN